MNTMQQGRRYDPCNADIERNGVFTEEERHKLERKLTRMLGWIGEKIPEEVIIEGKSVPLHELIWRLIRKKHLTDEEMSAVLTLEYKLEKLFNEDLEKVRHTDVEEDAAIRDYCEALGLMRAIITLKDIEAREYGGVEALQQKIRERRIHDTSSWLSFLKRIK